MIWTFEYFESFSDKGKRARTGQHNTSSSILDRLCPCGAKLFHSLVIQSKP